MSDDITIVAGPPYEISAQCAREIRAALERVAIQLETKGGNNVYQAAWRIAARIVRENKPD